MFDKTTKRFLYLFGVCAALILAALGVYVLVASDFLDKQHPVKHPKLIHLRHGPIDTRTVASLHETNGILHFVKSAAKNAMTFAMGAVPSMNINIKPEDKQVKTLLFHLDHTLKEHDETRDSLEKLGIKLGHYVPHNTYIATATDEQAKLAKQTVRGVVWVGEMGAHQKMPHRHLVEKHLHHHSKLSELRDIVADRKCPQRGFRKRKLMDSSTDKVEFIIHAHVAKHESKDKLEAEVKTWEEQMLKEIPELHFISLVVPSTQKIALGLSGKENAMRAAEWLTQKGLVHWVEIKPPSVVHNKYAAMLSQSFSNPESRPLWNMGISGQGQLVGAGDTGVDQYHCFFYDDKPVPVQVNQKQTVAPSTHRKFHALWSFMDAIDSEGGHGSHVSGTVAGNAHPTLAHSQVKEYDSLAKDAKFAFLDCGCDTDAGCRCPQDTQCECDLKPNRVCPRKFGVVYLPLDLNDGYFPWFYDKGVRIASNSWGTGYYKDFSFGYSTSSAEIDQFVWEHPDFLPVYAAGNSGGQFGYASLTSESEAKNALVVGAHMSSLESFQATANFTDYTRIVDRIKGELYQVYCLEASSLYDAQLCEKSKTFTQADCCNDGGKCAQGINDKCCGTQLFEQFPTLGFRCCPKCIEFEMANQQHHFSANNLALFTARGPTLDGRIKPDIVAVGDKVLSTKSAGTRADRKCAMQRPGDSLLQHEGTSMAAPVAASALVLVKQYFEEGYYPTGNKNPTQGFKPSAALLKAILIHSAQQLTGFIYLMSKHLWWPLQFKQGQRFSLRNPYLQGFGRIELSKALAKDTGLYLPSVIDRTLSTGETHSYCFDVRSNKPFKITLVWSDAPSSPASKINLVNDLDLIVVAPNKKIYYGNGISSVIGSTREEPDYLNNVEQVLFTDIIPGFYQVVVRAMNVPTGRQSYAIVMTGDYIVQPNCPAVPSFLTSELQKYINLSYAFGVLSVVAIPSLSLIALYFYIQFRRVTQGDRGYRDSSLAKGSEGEFFYTKVDGDHDTELQTVQKNAQEPKLESADAKTSVVNIQS